MPNPASDDVLSLDDARGLLFTKAANPNPPVEGENPPAAVANDDVEVDRNDEPDEDIVDNDDIPDDDEEDSDYDAAPSEGDTDTPADEGNTNAGEVDQGANALPPIEPPASWTAEEKATWNATPRKAQEAILRRELDGTKAIREAQNKSAEQQKTVEAEVGRLKGLTSQIDGYLNEKLTDLAKDFPDVKSEADLAMLGQTDPSRYLAFDARMKAINSAVYARAEAEKELNARAEQAMQQDRAKSAEALLEAFPAWRDAEVAKREVPELQDYVVKNYRVDEATARSTVDPIIYQLAQKAMLYDRAQAAKAQAVKRDPPRVVNKSGSPTNPRVSAREDARRVQFAKLDETGAIEDAIGLLRG